MANKISFKENIQNLKEFFRDPERPLWQRLGVVALVLLLLFYPLIKSCNRPSKLPPMRSSSEAFPSGPANLVDSTAQVDSFKALQQDIKENSTKSITSDLLRKQKIEAQKAKQKAEREKQARAAQIKDSETSTKEIKQDPGPFTQLHEKAPRPISIVEDPGGQLWIAHRYGLLRTSVDTPNSSKVILNRELFDRELNDDLKPISSLAVFPDDSVWLGLISGELLHYEHFEWTSLVKPFQSNDRRINSIVKEDNDILLAGRGMYKWRTEHKRLLRNPAFKGRALYTFVRSGDGTLFVTGKGGVWQYLKESRRWEHLWNIGSEDRAVYTAAAADMDSGLWLGTANGLARISNKGVLLERLLPKTTVTEILSGEGEELWVATLNDGLKLYDGESWYSARPKDGFFSKVSALHLDSTGRLWLGADGVGVFYAPVNEVRQWIKKFEDLPLIAAKPEIFGNACEAGAKLLRGAAVTGDIALDILDGSGVLFIKGKQICPRGLGYRRVDGSSVLIRDWRASLVINGKRTEQAIAKEIPVDKVTEVFLDSKSRIWFGTPQDGVFMIQGDSWKRFGEEQHFSGNPITSFLEDGSGNLWLGSTPHYLEAEKRFAGPNLHLYNDKGWFHYSPENNLLYYGTNSIAALSDGKLAIGSRAGLSIIDRQGQVTNYGTKQGNPERFAYSLTVDSRDRIWVVHQYFGKGIMLFDRKTFRTIGEKEGLFSNRISMLGLDRSKRVWLLAPNGSVGVYPLSFFNRKWIQTPVIEQRVQTLSMFD